MSESQQYSSDGVSSSISPVVGTARPKLAKKSKKGYRRSDFYRQSRSLHAWLSAFAFLALMFFSLTGLFLNHPEWFESNTASEEVSLQLSSDQLAQAQALENPADWLLQTVRAETGVVGRFKSAELFDDEVMIRLASPSGSTDISVLLESGEIAITTEQATTVSLLNDLHRGKEVGELWRWLIDISAVIILLLSVAGYVLFFSLKTRKATSLWLTASSLLIIIVIGWMSV